MKIRPVRLLKLHVYLLITQIAPGCALAVMLRTGAYFKLGLVTFLCCRLMIDFLMLDLVGSSIRQSSDAVDGINTLKTTHHLTVHPLSNYVDHQTCEELAPADIRLLNAQPKQRGVFTKGLVAYPARFGTSVLIVPDTLDPRDDFQKFTIYHELGHVRWSSSVVNGVAPWPILALIYIPALILCIGWLSHLGILAIAFLFYTMQRWRYHEVTADIFAVTRIMRAYGRERAYAALGHVRHALRRNLEKMGRVAQTEKRRPTVAEEEDRKWMLFQEANLGRYLRCLDIGRDDLLLRGKAGYLDINMIVYNLCQAVCTLAAGILVSIFPRVPSRQEVIALGAICIGMWLFVKLAQLISYVQQKQLVRCIEALSTSI